MATGNLEGAQNTLNQSTDISELSLNAIAEAQAKLGDIPSAINTVLSIESADNRNAAIRSVFESQIDIVDALKTAEALSYPWDKSTALETIAGMQLKNGDLAGALQSALKANALDGSSVIVSVYSHFGALACAGIAERDLFEPGRHDLMSFVHAKLRGTA